MYYNLGMQHAKRITKNEDGTFNLNKSYLKRGTIQMCVQITPEELFKAKALARSQGYTSQGWLGMLVRKAISEADGFDGNTSSQP